MSGKYSVEVSQVTDTNGVVQTDTPDLHIQVSDGNISDLGSPSFTYTHDGDGNLVDVAGNVFVVDSYTPL